LSRIGPEPAAGERWAYRARAQDDLVEVEVIRLGIKTPARVLVHWTDDAFEGQQDWVPAARLKALWSDLDTFRARERRWDAVTASSEQYSETISSAVRSVFDILVDEEVASLGYNATSGVLHVRDVTALATLAGLRPRALRDPASFEEDGELISPMTVSFLVAQSVAARNPYPILQYIDREEAEARREAIYGKVYPGRGRGKDWDISPEICRQVDEEHGQPVRAILRDWCGTEAVDVRAEISAARAEAHRLAELAAAALDALRSAGHVRTANRLERERGGLPPIAAERV
jgi:hypothetical protein